MSHESSRHTRTLTELAEYDFQIMYQPGAENGAADAMSRVMTPGDMDGSKDEVSKKLPKGHVIHEKVEGGGDALFLSLAVCFRQLNSKTNSEFTEDPTEIREDAVEYVLSNRDKFSVKFDKYEVRRLRSMKHEGQVPAEYIILAESL